MFPVVKQVLNKMGSKISYCLANMHVTAHEGKERWLELLRVIWGTAWPWSEDAVRMR